MYNHLKNLVRAPFTVDEVAKLEEWQKNDKVHPFTCETENRELCPNEGKLIPQEEGWVCPCGKYTQKWCHNFMVT